MSSLAELVLHRRRAHGTVSERGWAQLWQRVFDDGSALGRAHDVEPHMIRMIPSSPAVTLIAVGAWPMQYLFRWAAFAVIEDVPFLIPPVRGLENTVHLERVHAYDVPDLDDPDWQNELARRFRRAAGVDTQAPVSSTSSVPSIDLGPALIGALSDQEAVRVLEWLARMTGVGMEGLAEAELTPGLAAARAAVPAIPREVAAWEGGAGTIACVRLDHEIAGQAGGQRSEVAALRLVRGAGKWRFTRTVVAEYEREGTPLS